MLNKYNKEFCEKNNISYFTILSVHNQITNKMIDKTRKIKEVNKIIEIEKSFLKQLGIDKKQIEKIQNTINIIEKIKMEALNNE